MSPAYLIVNADDFGYFRCVSEGIVQAIRAGSVTATGVLANGEELTECVRLLLSIDRTVDVGVHLNLTWGAPLTPDIERSYARSGRFPGKMTLLRALLGGSLRQRDVEVEWSAQIERCLELGLKPRFLNSHEHVHMWPRLNTLARELAEAYGICHIRHVTPERPRGMAGVLRSVALSALSYTSGRRDQAVAPHLLGLSVSGKLDMRYMERRLSSLRDGKVYELMCHPGRLDPGEVQDRRLIAYHRWEDELRMLVDPCFQLLCVRRGLQLIGYRHLREEDGPLSVSPRS